MTVNEPTFSERLFNDPRSQKILELTKETVLITGMQSGTLNANYYGAFMVQDIAYLANGVVAYKKAALEIKEGIFQKLYNERAHNLYTRYVKPMQTDWHLKNHESVKLGIAAEKYVTFLHHVSTENPRYLAIAMLPCSMLWRSLANQLHESVSKASAYYTWFEKNKTEKGYRGTLEKFVDDHFGQSEFEIAKPFFWEALAYEYSFFCESGKEQSCTLPSNLK